MDTVDEGNTSILVLTFKDHEMLEVIPETATYRIDDLISGTNIKAWTPFFPAAATHEIVITSAENGLVNQANASEDRLVTVKWTYDTNKQGVKEYQYTLQNMRAIPVVT